ncbi:MAG TPA: hypothetical protein VNT55_23155 [Baekduia sp.]|nr:hypothetical protein [Baekduia sp.]
MLAHVGGVPVEEMLAYAGPAISAAAGLGLMSVKSLVARRRHPPRPDLILDPDESAERDMDS